MKLYHRTDAAEEILSRGFGDGTGNYLTVHEYSGVWLSDEPLVMNEGAEGRFLLVVEIPESAVEEFEWVETGKGFREFLVPAEVVNRYGPPALAEPD